jgi:hypothetical protein
MNRFGLRFHHFGLAVPNPCAAFRFLRALGYRLGPVVFDPLQQVNRILKRSGPMVYHLCYVAESPDAAIGAMEATGLNIIAHGEPKPAVLFGGQPVSFYSISDIGLIELIQGEPPPISFHARST